MHPWWPKIELKYYSTTVNKIITIGQIFVFEVSKQPYWSPLDESGTTNSLVAKNGTKKIIPPVDRFQSLRCLNDRIDLPYMMGSLASGATNSLVAKIGTKDLATSCWVYRIWNNGWILMFKVSKRPYRSPLHDRIICKWRQCLLGGQKWN